MSDQTENPAPNAANATEKTNGVNHDTGAELESFKNQIKEKEAKYLYLYAEFENFKKRMQKERSDLVKFGWESVARELLQVLDNLERGLAYTPDNTDKAWLEGLTLVLNQFKSTLEKQGVQVIPTLNQPFDPNLHEAVGQEPSKEAQGTIIKEQMKGYTLHGRLLRPARVIISSG